MLGVLIFLLVTAAILAVPVTLVILVVQMNQLRGRIARLEAQAADPQALADPSARAANLARIAVRSSASDAPPKTAPEPAQIDRPADIPLPAPRAAAPDIAAPSLATRAIDWIVGNWFYVAAAAALAFAGIFLVQYGAEQGLLTPETRVLAASTFGLALIACGEWVRRRFGDAADAATAYVPSLLSGGGIVTLMAAVLGARHLYGLLGAEVTLGLLVPLALAAIVLGWFHGPLLVAVGLLGGTIAPFIVGGDADAPHGLHAHFALIGLTGLAVDAVRRWPFRWVSALALICGIGGSGLLVVLSPATVEAHLIALVVLVIAAIALPVRQVWPRHGGAMVAEVMLGRVVPRPETWLASGAILTAALLAVLTSIWAVWSALLALCVFAGLAALWGHRARALQDGALWPALGTLAVVLLASPPDGAAAPTLGLLFGAALSAFAALRSLETARSTFRLGWALGAVLAAPIIGIALHLSWDAPQVRGSYPWAWHALAVAAGLTGLAGLWAARDGVDRLRASLAALIALVVIAYALSQVLGDAALTIAVALLAPMAAWFDMRLRLPLLSWFVLPSAVFTGWRLAVLPGADFALNGPLWIVLLI